MLVIDSSPKGGRKLVRECEDIISQIGARLCNPLEYSGSISHLFSIMMSHPNISNRKKKALVDKLEKAVMRFADTQVYFLEFGGLN